MALAGTCLLLACASERPVERRSALVPSRALELASRHDLVDLRSFAPGIAIDLRYASDDNALGRAVYPADMPCLLRRRTAIKLASAQQWLQQRGYGLRVWDAWRPPEVQLLMHDQAENGRLFLDPRRAWSRHCSGTAVDVTLVDLEGRECRLPTYHDESGPDTGYAYRGNNKKIAHHLWLLQSAMSQAGFLLLDSEWWHFDDAFYAEHPAPIVFGHQLDVRITMDPDTKKGR